MDVFTGKSRVRKTYSIFVSFIVCCLGTSLSISALATQYWFQSGCKFSGEKSVISNVHFGLFAGTNSLNGLTYIVRNTKVVCLDGDCMYSCGLTAELRKQQLLAVRNLNASEFDVVNNCTMVNNPASTFSRRPLESAHDAPVVVPMYASLISPFGSNRDDPKKRVVATGNSSSGFRVLEDISSSDVSSIASSVMSSIASSSSSITTSAPETSTHDVQPQEPEFMSYGLWVGTISCLVIGMVFAVIGALFAVINTATTPVEFITGVPGLYIWNSMAALFNLLCVILWAVQFHQHLTKNVLLYDADSGWTTEGLEVFGYSFWLVVVAIIVHIANIIIIFVGTYERKIKEQVEKPEEKSVNLMLY